MHWRHRLTSWTSHHRYFSSLDPHLDASISLQSDWFLISLKQGCRLRLVGFWQDSDLPTCTQHWKIRQCYATVDWWHRLDHIWVYLHLELGSAIPRWPESGEEPIKNERFRGVTFIPSMGLVPRWRNSQPRMTSCWMLSAKYQGQTHPNQALYVARQSEISRGHNRWSQEKGAERRGKGTRFRLKIGFHLILAHSKNYSANCTVFNTGTKISAHHGFW